MRNFNFNWLDILFILRFTVKYLEYLNGYFKSEKMFNFVIFSVPMKIDYFYSNDDLYNIVIIQFPRSKTSRRNM